MLSKNIDVDGLNIFYREAGINNAPKLVLLHGFYGGPESLTNAGPPHTSAPAM
jgi:pimeloyl-ACP methyl ester carboxylesterase